MTELSEHLSVEVLLRLREVPCAHGASRRVEDSLGLTGLTRHGSSGSWLGHRPSRLPDAASVWFRCPSGAIHVPSTLDLVTRALGPGGRACRRQGSK